MHVRPQLITCVITSFMFRSVAGQKYKFRLINGGQHFGYRITLGGLPLTVVAADSEPVYPVVMDEVILHTAERFEVEVTIPQNAAVGESWWIKVSVNLC